MFSLKQKLQKLLFTRSEQQAFLEDVSSLIKDGVPAPQAIETVEKISKSPTKDVARSILSSVSEGKRIAEGMEEWFPISIVEIIRAGEEGGALVDTMNTAAKALSQRKSAVTSFLGSTLYPVVVFAMACVVAVFLKHSIFANFVAMKPVSMWPENGRLVYEIATFIEGWWWLMLIIFAALLFAIREILINLTGEIRRFVDKLPLFSLYRTYVAANFMETLGLLLANGIGFKRGLSILQRKSSRYLAWHIYLMQFRLSGGRENIADVLDTGMVEKGDILRLQMMAKGKGFTKALINLGQQSLERNTENVKISGKIIGAVLLGLDAGFAIFMIFAVYGVGSFVAS